MHQEQLTRKEIENRIAEAKSAIAGIEKFGSQPPEDLLQTLEYLKMRLTDLEAIPGEADVDRYACYDHYVFTQRIAKSQVRGK